LPRWADLALLPVAGLLAALLLSGGIIALLGESPVQALKLMVTGAAGSQDAIGYSLYYATNFMFTGLAVAVAYHAGLFNIGGEGQAYVGGLGVGLVCLGLGHWPFWAVLPVAVLAAAAFGAAWAFLPAWLQARRGSHIVITTIMFNFIASALMTYLLVNVLIKPGQQSPETREFAANTWMPFAHELLAKAGINFSTTPLNLAFGLALAAAGFVWVFLWHTRWGYELRVVGQNQPAAVYAGISPARITVAAMLLSGALAGGLGLNELMGSQHRILIDFPSGAGFVGIAVALMGRNHPVGIFLAAVLFGALYQGGSQLTFDMPRINRDMVVVIQGLVILACGALENMFRQPLAALFGVFGGRPPVASAPSVAAIQPPEEKQS
jgi:simple sugar transport system permease protein